jgi:hypothetical protein
MGIRAWMESASAPLDKQVVLPIVVHGPAGSVTAQKK